MDIRLIIGGVILLLVALGVLFAIWRHKRKGVSGGVGVFNVGDTVNVNRRGLGNHVGKILAHLPPQSGMNFYRVEGISLPVREDRLTLLAQAPAGQGAAAAAGPSTPAAVVAPPEHHVPLLAAPGPPSPGHGAAAAAAGLPQPQEGLALQVLMEADSREALFDVSSLNENKNTTQNRTNLQSRRRVIDIDREYKRLKAERKDIKVRSDEYLRYTRHINDIMRDVLVITGINNIPARDSTMAQSSKLASGHWLEASGGLGQYAGTVFVRRFSPNISWDDYPSNIHLSINLQVQLTHITIADPATSGTPRLNFFMPGSERRPEQNLRYALRAFIDNNPGGAEAVELLARHIRALSKVCTNLQMAIMFQKIMFYLYDNSRGIPELSSLRDIIFGDRAFEEIRRRLDGGDDAAAG